MPITCRYCLERNLAIIAHCGVISDAELASFYRAFHGDGRFSQLSKILIDLRRKERSEIGSPILEKLAREMKARSTQAVRPYVVAIVARSDIAYGLARMYDSFRASEQQHIAIFRDMDEALAWLDLPVSLLDEIGDDE